MNSRIVTLPQLADAIARATGVPIAEAEKFVVELAEEISSRLSSGEHVVVPGIGTFAIGGADGNDVLWRPDHALEQEVNSPFAFFEPVEVADDVTEETLSQPLDADEIVRKPDAVSDVPEQSAEETAELNSVEENVEAESAEVAPESADENGADTVSDQQAPEPEVEKPSEEPVYDIVEVSEQKSRFGWLELLLGLALGLVLGFIVAVYSPNPQLTPIRSALSGDAETEIIEDADTFEVIEPEETVDTPRADTVASEPAAEISEPQPSEKTENTDVVTSTRYLTTMARQYYGDYHFWVYIYLYNKDIIADPDRIPAGTRVRIPDASLYGIDASSPQSVATAQAMIESIKNDR